MLGPKSSSFFVCGRLMLGSSPRCRTENPIRAFGVDALARAPCPLLVTWHRADVLRPTFHDVIAAEHVLTTHDAGDDGKAFSRPRGRFNRGAPLRQLKSTNSAQQNGRNGHMNFPHAYFLRPQAPLISQKIPRKSRR